MKTITSRDNPFFKQLRALADDAREQRRQGLTILDGPHLVATYLSRCGSPRHLLVSQSGFERDEVQALLAAHAPLEATCLKDSLFREISGTQAPVGVLSVITIPDAATGTPDGDCVLLDGVQDAGNVGSILRTAAAAGIRDVLLGPGCAGVWTPRVLRAAQGAHFSLSLREQVDLTEMLNQFSGNSCAAVAVGGLPPFVARLSGPVAWVFGSEGQGIRGEVLSLCTNAVTIPMVNTSESLNVAAAAAICIFESVRQKLAAGGGEQGGG